MQQPTFHSYSFWDLETTGTDISFDHPLQHAAVLTGADWVPKSVINLQCRPRKHTIPHPKALLVTKTDVREALARKTSLYEMMGALDSHYARLTPTIHIGFNSIAFDEEMQRRCLWQNLFAPYATQFNGHCRADVLKIAYVAHALRPGCFNTTLNDKGRPSFKLQDLARANGITTRNAHDAVGDTYTTIELLKMLNQVAGPVVDACLALALKSTSQKIICRNEAFAEVRSFYGRVSIVPLARVYGAEASTEFATFDLNYDPGAYIDLDVASLCDVMLGKRGPRVVSFVKTNRASCFLPLDHDLLAGLFSGSQLQTFRERARQVRDSKGFSLSTAQAAEARANMYEAAEFLEHRIYEGFTSRADAEVISQFHAVEPTHKWGLVQRLGDERLRQIAERLIWEEWPNALPRRERDRIETGVIHRLTSNERVPWTTIHSARRDAEQLMQAASETEAAILRGVLRYLAEVDDWARKRQVPDAAD